MTVEWSRAANRNLESVEEYIGRDNPSAAIETVLEILRQVGALADHPALGRPGRVHGTRELVIARLPFIVPYAVRGDRIIVIRVLRGARKWPRRLGR